jgi:hypothetical protein
MRTYEEQLLSEMQQSEPPPEIRERPIYPQPRRMLRCGTGTPRPAVWLNEAERQAWLDNYDPNWDVNSKRIIELVSLDDL